MTTILSIAEEHERRAAEFCRRHRDFTTTEAMDDLAAEFEKLARVTRFKVLRWLRGTHGGFVYADDYVAENVGHVDPCDHRWEPMKEYNAKYDECANCLSTRLRPST